MGKAQQAYAALRAAFRKKDETNRELPAGLQDLADKWTQGCNTREELKDLIVLEQLVSKLPENVLIWVKE